MSTMSPALTMFINIGMVIVIWMGGIQASQGSLTVGQIVAFTNYLITTMIPLTMMTMLSNTWASGMVSARRVNEILDTIPEVLDNPETLSLPEEISGRIEFKNVTFSYHGDESEAVLEDINLIAEPGQTVAILGATGAGKSTLINLIPRFYDVSSGQVLLDGIDIRRLKQDSLLSYIGIVPQESILFSGSVGENIRYGCPEASDEEVIAAARAAQAHEFIMEMAKGYDTHIEERGANLSGGQKQRLAIARAILMQPKILILDDATSSVDVETETKIQDALDEVMRRRTSLVVAQRISTVLRADKIVIIDKGEIAAQGTHQDLIESSPIYQEIYESQLGNGFNLEEERSIGGGRTEE
jgi:ATP-binding cassette subfamily B protein